MDFIVVATLKQFDRVERKTVSVLGKKLLLTRNADGSFHCIEIQCKHQGADLSQATVLNHVVTCPRHGWRYHLQTGECLNNTSSPLRRHEVLIEGDAIKISVKPIES